MRSGGGDCKKPHKWPPLNQIYVDSEFHDNWSRRLTVTDRPHFSQLPKSYNTYFRVSPCYLLLL